MRYSIIIPVYNRPDEVRELLQSLTIQQERDFEVIVVEDGSQNDCAAVCQQYEKQLRLTYCRKSNSGPGQSRNYGAKRAAGDYLLILDSDVVLPPGYLEAITKELQARPCDAFGGADAAHPAFTPVQKAISYSMTSFFTTGGIRGGRKQLDRFYPRSYNMGIRREVYRQLGGFSKMRFGEDIDFSYRIIEAGYTSRLFPDAWVWHKRRTDLRKFWRQVYNSGIARINLTHRHPGTLKAVHLLPAVFAIGTYGLLLLSLVGLMLMLTVNPLIWLPLCLFPLLPLLFYSAIICLDSTLLYRSLKVGVLSVAAAFTQLCGYGSGFLSAWWRRNVRGKDEFQAYEKTFYK